MKKLTLFTMLLFTAFVKADVVVTNVVTTVTIVSSNTVTVANAKYVYTSFSIQYLPPDLTRFKCSLSYFLKDVDTGKEIKGTRKTDVIEDTNLMNFMATNNIPMTKIIGLGEVIDAYLLKKQK